MADYSPINDFLTAKNIAELLPESKLDYIGKEVIEWYGGDEESRSEWMERNDMWMKLASQLIEEKTFPWRGASNVKYPLLTTAAIQFHARAYPALINGPEPVKASITGKDDLQQTKHKRARRIGSFMSYQILHKMRNWQDEMDRALFILPIVGMVYKKTYYSPILKNPVSKLVTVDKLVLNYHATDFELARKTETLWLTSNEILENVRSGYFRDIELGEPSDDLKHSEIADDIHGASPLSDNEDTYEVLECHCFWDLDDDGYKEPYIVTVDKRSEKVLRIIPRYTNDDVEYNDDGEIIRINPIEYYTQYVFLPDPQSPLYGMGFGALLGPINSSVNTIINQLTDAGTLSNLQGGFLGKGIRIPGGPMKFKPGEWKSIKTTGDDIRKNIYPMPVRDPSPTLFSLLGTLISSGERLSSVTDIMVGENPGQNQPYSTTMAVLEQGMKVFVGIYRRIYSALTKEYMKLYRINHDYLDDYIYDMVLEDGEEVSIVRDDFSGENTTVSPSADPNLVSEAQRLARAESLLQKLAMGLPLNQSEVIKRLLDAEGHEDVELLMQVPPPQPPFEQMLEQAKFQWQQRMDQMNLQLDAIRIDNEAVKDKSQAMMNMAKVGDMKQKSDLEDIRFAFELVQKRTDNKSQEDISQTNAQSTTKE